MNCIQICTKLYLTLPYRKEVQGTNFPPAEETPLPPTPQTKIQGECMAIAPDAYHTNELCQFCLIDSRTKTKFPRKWQSSKTTRLPFDPRITTVSPQCNYICIYIHDLILFPKQRVSTEATLTLGDLQVYHTNIQRANSISATQQTKDRFSHCYQSTIHRLLSFYIMHK